MDANADVEEDEGGGVGAEKPGKGEVAFAFLLDGAVGAAVLSPALLTADGVDFRGEADLVADPPADAKRRRPQRLPRVEMHAEKRILSDADSEWNDASAWRARRQARSGDESIDMAFPVDSV